MSKIKKILLHVGPYKTGSTSIQAVSHCSREILLNEYNILYPSFHYDHGPLFRNAFKKNPQLCHNNIINNKNINTIKEEVDVALNKMEVEIKKSDCEILLISGEHISDLSESEFLKLKTYLNQICPVIEICYFVREPSKLILSDLQESVKTGRATLNNWSFDYIIPRYHQKLNILKNVFGKENLIILNFEEAIAYEKGLVQYFFDKVFDIDFHVEGEQKANDSISDFSFKLLEKLNTLEPSVVDGQKNISRSNKLVKVLKSHKGSKINIELPLSNDFIINLNKALCLLEADFDIYYHPIQQIERLNTVSYVDSNDLKTFIENLNQQFLKHEKEITETANILRDAAVALEQDNLSLAIKLMTQAAKLRPHGPFIKNKLTEYEGLLNENK